MRKQGPGQGYSSNLYIGIHPLYTLKTPRVSLAYGKYISTHTDSSLATLPCPPLTPKVNRLRNFFKRSKRARSSCLISSGGWIWDHDHIRDLLVSVGRSFPIGTVMLLEAGGEVRFETRPVEGVEDKVSGNQKPEKLILDGQQRLTTLTQVISLEEPVYARTSKRKKVKRHYYFNIRKALKGPEALEGALIAVDENRKLYTRFRRNVELDLSTTELECRKLYFPCNRIMNANDWEIVLHKVAPDHIGIYFDFRERVIDPLREYQIPVIQLKKKISKEAVCSVFEKVNTGGVQLTVFELVTASYAADGYNLRADWFGSKEQSGDSRKGRLEKAPLLKGIEATAFLQGISLLHTHDRSLADIRADKIGKQVRPVGAKRGDILRLPLAAWKNWADSLEAGFRKSAVFLRKQGFYSTREVPYRTQLVPLAAVLTRLGGNKWLEPQIYQKLMQWFWSGVLGELYGSAVETRMANDYEGLIKWIDVGDPPRTVKEAIFHAERFDTLRSRSSAAYKGVNALVLRENARDWFLKTSIEDLYAEGYDWNIHHIFPVAWCNKQDPPVSAERYQSILNKTSISRKANLMMSGKAPSQYIPLLQSATEQDDAQMDKLLKSHFLSSRRLRQDAYDKFIEDRRDRLSQLIETAMGKPVIPVGVADLGGEN